MNARHLRWRIIGRIIACCLLAGLAAGLSAARADKAGDRKRELLAQVKRLVVVAPFTATDTLDKVYGAERWKPATRNEEPGEKPAEAPPASEEARLKQYAALLRKVEAHARERLSARAAARLPFEVVTGEEVAKALAAQEWTPADLFERKGKMQRGRFAKPDPQAIRALAERLKADAVLVGTLDEPRRAGGGYFFSPFGGLGYDSPHVRCKGSFSVLMADGAEAHRTVIEVLQPATRLGSREFVSVDWLEATSLVIENLMDEITRYAPAKKAASPGPR